MSHQPIHEKIREMRRSAKLTAAQLCTVAEIETRYPKQYVSNIEAGKTGVSVAQLEKICTACGYSIEFRPIITLSF